MQPPPGLDMLFTIGWVGICFSKKTTEASAYHPDIPLYSVLMCLVNKCASFARWFWSHQGHIGQKKAIIAVSKRLLKMIYILLEKGQYYDPKRTVKTAE